MKNEKWKQQLFEYLIKELDVIALDSQLQDIERIINPVMLPDDQPDDIYYIK